MAGYDRLYALLIEELNQLSQEGRDIDCEKYRERINSCNEDKQSLMQIYSELCALPMRADYRYNEPSELEEIFAESDINKLPDDKYTPVDAEYFRGAWLGRCIGCALGQPVEGWQSERIIEWYKTAGKYPIKYYVPTVSGERRNEGLATDEKLCGMPLDDSVISKESDGTFNEEYCKWCYINGEFTYHRMDDLIEFCAEHMANDQWPSDQVRAYMKEMLPKLNYWKQENNV